MSSCGERLLDQKEVETVEFLERGQVVERVRRIGIDLKRQVREAFADGPHHLDIMTGSDLELDPAITFVKILVNLCEERAGSVSIPRLTPEAISVRVPPIREATDLSSERLSRSHDAISSPALAKLFPFTRW